MNWLRLYAVLQISLVHLVSWVLSVVFFSFLFSALFRRLFNFDELDSYVFFGGLLY